MKLGLREVDEDEQHGDMEREEALRSGNTENKCRVCLAKWFEPLRASVSCRWYCVIGN